MRATLSTTTFLVGLLVALSGCGGGSTTETTTTTTTTETTATTGSEGALVAPGEAHIGDRTTCPVSGEEFVVTESSPSVVHEGHTYYFCCPHCAERFQADPSQFQGTPPAHEHHDGDDAT